MDAPAKTSSAPPTPSSPVTLEINLLIHPSTGKVILGTTDSKIIQILYGFMLFPVSALECVNAGAITSVCKSLRELENQNIRQDFDKTQIFKPRPTTFPLPDPFLISLMNGNGNDLAVAEDDFRYLPTLYTCEKACPTTYLARDPGTRCRGCDGSMHIKAPVVDSEAKSLNDAAGGGYVKPIARFLISNNMEIRVQESVFDIFRLAEEAGYNLSDLHTVSMSLDEVSILAMLKACVLSSENVLTEFYKHKLMIIRQKESEEAAGLTQKDIVSSLDAGDAEN